MDAESIYRVLKDGTAAERQALARALHRLAVELFAGTPDHGLQPSTLSGLAANYVRACNRLGRAEEAVAVADKYILLYERIGELINVGALKLGRIEAFINLNRLDDAARALEDPSLPGNPATDIELARL